MEFDSLSRRELQSLCKKNKIPANMTNVAMADALNALEHVEGLDDILIQAESNPLQSPANPRSARRKPSNAEPGSSKSLASARPATRRTAAEEVNEENKNVNIAETPTAPTTHGGATVHSARQKVVIHLEKAHEVPEERDVPESPAVATSQRRAPPTSCRWKIDGQKDEASVQRVYSTRRSVRLLEKTMSGLSLKEQGRLEPIKMIEDEGNEGKKETSETKSLAISPGSAQETYGLESSVRDSNGLLEDNKKTNDYVIGEAKAKDELGAEKSGELEDPLVSAVQYQYESEGSNKIDVLFEENGENTADMSDESIQEKGTDVVVARVSHEIESSNIVSQSETNEELNDSHEFSFVEVPAVSDEIMDHVTHSHSSPQEINDTKKEEILLFNERDESKVVESQQFASSNPDLEAKYASDEEPKAEKSEEKPSESHQKNGSGETFKDNAPFLPEGIDSVKFESAREFESSEYFADYGKSDEVIHQLVSESCDMNDFPDDSTVEDYSDIGQNAQFAPDSLPGQFPRPYLSSAKKQTTLPMMMQDSGINKENIDLSGCNLQAKNDKMEANNVIDKGGKVALEGESIRSLKKMLKKKFMITESTKEIDSNVPKEGKTRPALQMLPENCMPVEEM